VNEREVALILTAQVCYFVVPKILLDIFRAQSGDEFKVLSRKPGGNIILPEAV